MEAAVFLSHFPKLTSKRSTDLQRLFPSLKDALTAPPEAFEKIGWKKPLIDEFVRWRQITDPIILQKTLDTHGITTISLNDPAYPSLLKELYDPPLTLFVRGTLRDTAFSIAVVGPRKCTAYGRQVTEQLVAPLAKAGMTIVSGLALGIDAIAHSTTLNMRGTTIAVLGGGIDAPTVQPSQHRHLSENIINAGGAIISEYPPGTQPTRYTFPRRNRIIAGLTRGTLVIEAGKKSGALITAQCALDTNREVFAVPQNITSLTAAGTNNLLKVGAHPITSATDILDILDMHDVKQFVENKQILPDTPTEAKVLEHLTREPLHVDDIIRMSSLEGHIVTSTLTLMEMKGKIKNMGGMMYVIAS